MLLPATPFQAKLGTNYAPSAIEIVTINDILLKVDEMTAQLERQMEALKAKHAAVSSFAASHRALLSPIRRVPADILTTIFLLCMDSKKECTMTPDESPLLLTRVCHHWRELAINTPSLWADVSVDVPHYPSSYLSFSRFTRDVSEQEEELLDVVDEDEAAAVLEMARGGWQKRIEMRTELVNMWLERGRQCPLYHPPLGQKSSPIYCRSSASMPPAERTSIYAPTALSTASFYQSQRPMRPELRSFSIRLQNPC
ncbi:hypothetical protein BKA70DRAFT_1319309, partial [Coprinopsis sp. MPI-PUGE-AT-0042]